MAEVIQFKSKATSQEEPENDSPFCMYNYEDDETYAGIEHVERKLLLIRMEDGDVGFAHADDQKPIFTMSPEEFANMALHHLCYMGYQIYPEHEKEAE